MAEGYAGKYIAANGSYDISEEPCRLKRIVLNDAGASANLLTVKSYGSSPDTYAIIDTVNANVNGWDFDMFCPKGLTVILATGTAADITVIYG